MYTFANILSPINTATGLAEKIYLAPVRWFAKNGIKSPSNWMQKGDEVIIHDTHEFLPGKAFFECTLAPEKNSYDAKSTGDIGFIKFENALKVILPGSYSLLHETIKNILNEPCIALIKDANCAANIWYQIGNDCNYAYLKADFDTSTTKDGAKDYAATITNSAANIYLYDGEILTLDEVVIVPGDNILLENGSNIITEDFESIITE